MKAAVISGYGGPDRLEIREVEKPAPGPGQLLVRVRAAAVNPIDWKLRKGQLRLVKPARFPLILGYDVAGEVEAVGAEVGRFAPGDAVYALLDSPHGGGYAEYVLVGEEAAAPKPERLSFEEAAAVPVGGLTALQALRDKGELAEGERLLVVGGAGGVGHFTVQLGKALGAHVVAVASGRNQAFLGELGAGRGIDYEQEDFTTDEETYHVVFDAAGNSSFRECDLILEEGGVYVTTVVGPAIFIRSVASTLAGLFGPARRCRSVIVKPSGQDLAFLGRLIDAGRLRPHVEEVFRLERIADAHSYSETGHVRGKLVIRIE
ncbi:MAG TPA: NAD(P)-dependent alcohol dehydrogenase [Thermoanaerobaculia bacterium]|nr:NAD(P)-dependent alcohol dehydrogenase [Thermoanaerobaculia bacterium]